MATPPIFQAGHAGSIPVARSVGASLRRGGHARTSRTGRKRAADSVLVDDLLSVDGKALISSGSVFPRGRLSQLPGIHLTTADKIGRRGALQPCRLDHAPTPRGAMPRNMPSAHAASGAVPVEAQARPGRREGSGRTRSAALHRRLPGHGCHELAGAAFCFSFPRWAAAARSSCHLPAPGPAQLLREGPTLRCLVRQVRRRGP